MLVERAPEVPVLDMHEHVDVLGALLGVGSRRTGVRVAVLSEGSRRLQRARRNFPLLRELVFDEVALEDLLRGRTLGADPEQLLCGQVQIGLLHEAGAVAAQLIGSKCCPMCPLRQPLASPKDMLEGRCLRTNRFLWSDRHLELSLAEGLSVELDRGRCSTSATRSDPLINLSGDVSFIWQKFLVGRFKACASTDNALQHGDDFCLHQRLS